MRPVRVALPTLFVWLILCVASFAEARPLEIVFADMEGGAGILIVFQVNHHGLRQSNHPLLCQAIDPTVAIMLNGRRKGAHPEVHAALKRAPHLQTVYQMHPNMRNPEVNPATAFIANPGANTSGTPIRVTCDLEGGRFGVICGIEGQPTWYAIRPD